MIKYVAGFLFDRKGAEVVLIEKNHPEWQAGKLNGIGGKIREGETPREAMRREFSEEAGVIVRSWKVVCALSLEGVYIVTFFKAFSDDLHKAQTTEEEEIVFIDVAALPDNIIPNLRWIIPLCLDKTIKPFFVDDLGGD